MALLMDDSVYMLLQVQIAPRIIDDTKTLAGAINNMNNNVRPFKFTVSGRRLHTGTHARTPAENTTFNPALVNAIMGEAVKLWKHNTATLWKPFGLNKEISRNERNL